MKPVVREMRHEPTPAESVLWQHLRRKELARFKFRRQHPIGQCVVDFYCPQARLVVEVDGPIHLSQCADDMARQQYLETQDVRVIRFSNHEVLERPESVLAAIMAAAGDTDWRSGARAPGNRNPRAQLP